MIGLQGRRRGGASRGTIEREEQEEDRERGSASCAHRTWDGKILLGINKLGWVTEGSHLSGRDCGVLIGRRWVGNELKR